MPSRISRRPLSPQNYVAGSTQTYKFDTTDVLRRACINLTQQPTLTTGNNTPALTANGDDLAAVPQIQLKANGADTIVRCALSDLPWINYFLSGGENPAMNVNLGSGVANPMLDSTVYLDFGPKIFAKQSDTWLFAGALRQLTMDVSWAGPGGVAPWTAINASATGYTTPPSLSIFGEYASLGVKTSQSAGAAPSATIIYPNTGLRIVSNTEVVPGNTQQFQFDMDSGVFSYVGFIIHVQNTSTLADTGGLFQSLTVANGPTTYVQGLPEDVLNSMSYLGKNRNQLKTTAGVPYNMTPRVSASSSMAGWYFLNCLTDGRIREAIPTNGTNQLYLGFNNCQGCTITVIGIQLLDLTQRGGNPSVTN